MEPPVQARLIPRKWSRTLLHSQKQATLFAYEALALFASPTARRKQMSVIDSPVAEHHADWDLGVEELDEFTVPLLDFVTGLVNSVLGLVIGLLGPLLGGL
jgi:hypothetical protein